VTFILAKLFWFVVEPLNFATFLLVAATGLILTRRWERAGRRSLTLVVAVFALVPVLPVETWLARPLEARFPSVPVPARIDGVIVLGGAVDADLSRVNGEPEVGEAVERIHAFVEIMRAHPEARGVVTGGNGRLFPGEGREDAPTRAVFRQIGFDDGRVVYENESRDTWDNAVLSRRLVDPRPNEAWVLITSAAHMPRAMGVFRRVGWPVFPHPVDHRAPIDGKMSPAALDAARSWERSGEALREWIGLVAYRLLDRTDAFFPAPRFDVP